MDILGILKDAAEKKASDIFIVAGIPVSYKINGNIVRTDGERLMPDDTKELIEQMYHMSNEVSMVSFEKKVIMIFLFGR